MLTISAEYEPIRKWDERSKYIDSRGYVRVECPEHPKAYKGYALEHRLVVESMLGRILDSDEVIHHLDHDKTNNNPENLYLTTPEEHARIHARARRWTMDTKTEIRKKARERAKSQRRGRGGKFKK